MQYGFDHSWIEVQRFASRREAEQHALVLAAVGIACRLVPRGRGFLLLVTEEDAERAQEELAAYRRENHGRTRKPSQLRAMGEGVDGVLAYCAVLVFLHSASGRRAFGQDWWNAGLADAGLITSGEWWRALTSLGLHADLAHLGSNLLFGSLFGLLVAQHVGAGLAWLAILLAGTSGNVLNALLRADSHTAIGASTAVFAAVGLLAALAFWHQLWRQGLRRWLPLAGGVMLLTFLGTGGPRTDVGAHVAGFVAGVAFGLALAFLGRRVPQGPRAQLACGLAAFVLFALAWLRALSAHA